MRFPILAFALCSGTAQASFHCVVTTLEQPDGSHVPCPDCPQFTVTPRGPFRAELSANKPVDGVTIHGVPADLYSQMEGAGGPSFQGSWGAISLQAMPSSDGEMRGQVLLGATRKGRIRCEIAAR